MSNTTDVIPNSSTTSINKSLDLLKKIFGYSEFRSDQANIITHVLNKKDSLVLMPTGGGKSLCYQLPALQLEGTALVVSPLISLMQDQVMALRQLGVQARYWNSSLSVNDVKQVVQELQSEQLKLLYLAPERLMMEGFDELLQNCIISLIAIDEAHCISEWGHEFRSDYRHLYRLKQKFPDVPVIALTATATSRVIKDIQVQLQIPEATIFQSSFDRKNLFYEVQYKSNTFQKIIEFIAKRKDQSGIIYAQSRKQVDALTEKLNQKGIKALAYHAGLSDKQRQSHQEKFIHDQINIIVATIAFGMGINKPDVRFVIHHDLPKTIENYYQETGRAGRDGEESHCLLFFSYADKQKYENFILQMTDSTEQAHAKKKLNQMLQFASQAICRRKQVLKYFEQDYHQNNCQKCDVCINPPQLTDISIESQKLLSCIYRVKQRFGSQVIVDVLTGKQTTHIRNYKLDQLSVYNIEKNYSQQQLKDMLHYLVFIDAVNVVGDQYPILKLGNQASVILKGEKKVYMPLNKVLSVKKSAKKSQKNTSDYDFKDPLYEKLKELRTQLAKQRAVPPYIIFPDRTLKEMAHFRPKSIEEFKQLNGVGDKKAKRYATDFLNLINDEVSFFNL